MSLKFAALGTLTILSALGTSTRADEKGQMAPNILSKCGKSHSQKAEPRGPWPMPTGSSYSNGWPRGGLV